MSAFVFVFMCAASLHSPLNEPIMGVYVALMRVSVRRETLHRSPPNQWGLAHSVASRFSPVSSILYCITPLPFSTPQFLSILPGPDFSLCFLLCSISRRWEWSIRPIGHEESIKWSKMRPSKSWSASSKCCKSHNLYLKKKVFSDFQCFWLTFKTLM